MSVLAARVSDVRSRIRAAATRAGRRPDDVTLVAVSKTFPVESIRAASSAGITTFGENRAQEFAQKAGALGNELEWHFVGHLQTNKVRHVVGRAALIHSLDRLGLAEALDGRAARVGVLQPVLIEVNVSGEASKHGIEPGQVAGFAAEVKRFHHLEVRGLMTLAPLGADPEASRPHFRALADLRTELMQVSPSATDLSMGMTRDYEVAVEEGATIVRVGEAIFGKRGG